MQSLREWLKNSCSIIQTTISFRIFKFYINGVRLKNISISMQSYVTLVCHKNVTLVCQKMSLWCVNNDSEEIMTFNFKSCVSNRQYNYNYEVFRL